MEIVSIERSTYDELQTSFNKFVSEMKAMAGKGKDKRLGEWLDSQDVCLMLDISPRTLQTLRDTGVLGYTHIDRKIYYKSEDVNSILHVVESRKREAALRRHRQASKADDPSKNVNPDADE